jgi:hypothetical protein
VNAGLLPKLDALGDYLVISCRPKGHPFQSIASTILPHLAINLNEVDGIIEARKLEQALSEGEISLQQITDRILELHPGTSNILLIIDQFEELYSLNADPQVQLNFLDALLELADNQLANRAMLLITMRADFLGQALNYRPFANAIQERSLILGPMNHAELRDAIEKPGENQGGRIRNWTG